MYSDTYPVYIDRCEIVRTSDADIHRFALRLLRAKCKARIIKLLVTSDRRSVMRQCYLLRIAVLFIQCKLAERDDLLARAALGCKILGKGSIALAQLGKCGTELLLGMHLFRHTVCLASRRKHGIVRLERHRLRARQHLLSAADAGSGNVCKNIVLHSGFFLRVGYVYGQTGRGKPPSVDLI